MMIYSKISFGWSGVGGATIQKPLQDINPLFLDDIFYDGIKFKISHSLFYNIRSKKGYVEIKN